MKAAFGGEQSRSKTTEKKTSHDPSGFRTPASAPFGSPSARGYLRKRPSGRSISAAPRPLGRCARILPAFVQKRSLPQRARRGGVWGSCSRFKRLANSASPAPRGYARESPKYGRIMRCTPASAQASSDRLRRRPSVGPYLRVAFGEGIPSARGRCAWRCAPKRQVCRYTGRVTAAKPPKEKRGGFSANKFARNPAALFLPAQSAISRSYFRFELRARADSPRFAAVCPCGARRGVAPH